MIYIDVKRAGFDDMVAAGLVLTGGTASLPGHRRAVGAGAAHAGAHRHPAAASTAWPTR